jgi:hypothetical protein
MTPPTITGVRRSRSVEPDEPDTRVDCGMHTEQGAIHRCPVCGAVVVDRFGPWPLKSTVPGPPPPEGATRDGEPARVLRRLRP